MKCPNCNSTLSLKSNRCDRCGQDVKIYKKIMKASNAYYNQGLMKAKVRDLSGAVVSLRKSLELDKRNTNARNLLGLVYYEMGEVVAALSEWVISKHFEANENIADEYMNAIQNNPTKLDTINQSIKKYNSALISANQGNGDLAIIQLKKVVGLNPKFIRAYQLLALLYIEQGDNSKAERYLQKANRIDVNNTLTLKYLKEIGAGSKTTSAHIDNKESKEEKRQIFQKETDSFMPVGSYKEDKANIWRYINLLLGAIVGVAVTCILVIPTVKSTSTSDLKKQLTEARAEVSTYKTKYDNLTNQNDSESSEKDKKIKDLEAQIKEYTTADTGTVADSLYNGALNLINSKHADAAEALVDVDRDKLSSDAAKDLYDKIKDKTFSSASRSLFSEGLGLYNKGKYDDALKKLQNSYKFDDQNADPLYFIGRCYEKMDDKENAKKYYNDVMEKFPNKKRFYEARSRLKRLGD